MPFEPWTPQPSERDVLIEKVKYGKLTPDQAAQEADRLELEPLEFYPNPTDFDPMKEPTWSLPMTLAWIMWRTPDAVREMWDAYRKEFRFWLPSSWQVPGGPVYEGYLLEEGKNRAECLDLAIAAAQDPPAIAEAPEAFQLLRTGAQRAAWKATGIPTDGGHRREILPFEWVDFLVERCRGVRVRMTQSTGYSDCCFPVAGLVQESFPACGVSTAQVRNTPALVRRRGDFPKVKKAINEVYQNVIPEALDDADVARKVAHHIQNAGGKVPHKRTLLNHIREIRGS